MTDYSEPAPRPEQTIRSQHKLTPENDALFNRVFSNTPDVSRQQAIISTGQVESMNVPSGWVKRASVKLPAGAGLVEYNPVGHPDIRLNSFYRGHRISDDGAKAFKDCLNEPPHLLKPNELQGLAEAMRDKAYDFKGTAKTEDLNGKRVLVVEGRYNDEKKTNSQTIFVDADGTGSAVQEISFTACDKDYTANLMKAEKAFKSIIWKFNPGAD